MEARADHLDDMRPTAGAGSLLAAPRKRTPFLTPHTSSGDILGGAMVQVVSSSVASLEFSGAGLGSALTQSVSGPGTYEFGGVEFLNGSNTLTVVAKDSGGQTLATQNVTFNAEGYSGLENANCAAAAQVKKRVSICVKNKASTFKNVSVGFGESPVPTKGINPGEVEYFTKVTPVAVGGTVRIVITVDQQTQVDTTITVR